MLKEFGSERLIGMLHAFVLLRPVVDKAIRQKEQAILDITDLNRFESFLEQSANFDNLDLEHYKDNVDILEECTNQTQLQVNSMLRSFNKMSE